MNITTILEASPPRVFDIPEDEEEGLPSTSGSLNSEEFSLVADEVIAEVPNDDNEVDGVFPSRTYQDYLVHHPPQLIPRPT